MIDLKRLMTLEAQIETSLTAYIEHREEYETLKQTYLAELHLRQQDYQSERADLKIRYGQII